MAVYDLSGTEIQGKNVNEQWVGKKAAFLGDSITYGVRTTKTYWQYLQDMLDLASVSGYGVDGSTVSSKSNPMYGRITNIASDNDVAFLFGGTNDFYGNVAMGDWYTTSGGTRTFDETVTTFRGALNHTLLMLIDKFPTKNIILLTPIHRNTFQTQLTDMQSNTQGLYLEDYVDAVREAGSIFSVNVIDLYHDSGLFPYDSDNATAYFNTANSDKLHPNATGHERIAKCIAAHMSAIACN